MRSTACFLAGSAAIFAAAAHAEPAALASSNDWKSDFTLYLFLPVSTTGTSTLDGRTAPIDLDLGEALELLDFGASVRYEAWRNNFGLIAEGNYLSLSQDADLPGPGGGAASIEAEQWWLTFLGAYRVASGINGANGNRYSFDLQAGARYNSIKQEFTIAGPGPGVTLGGTETWWEPVFGARYLWQVSERWTLGALADVGGFGVNGSNLHWSATLGADYALSERGALKLGLRYYSIDFETERPEGTFAYDVEQVGPFVGYTIRF